MQSRGQKGRHRGTAGGKPGPCGQFLQRPARSQFSIHACGKRRNQRSKTLVLDRGERGRTNAPKEALSCAGDREGGTDGLQNRKRCPQKGEDVFASASWGIGGKRERQWKKEKEGPGQVSETSPAKVRKQPERAKDSRGAESPVGKRGVRGSKENDKKEMKRRPVPRWVLRGKLGKGKLNR